MEDIRLRLENIFGQTIWDRSITIISTAIILLIINYFLNKVIKKHVTTNKIVVMRVKKICLFSIMIATICLQIDFLQSFAKTLLASGGIFAVIIGLASQEAASNIINGAMILGYKPYHIGDTISIPEQQVRGKVIDITLRHTVMETLEKTQLIIPNTIMNRTLIENISNIPNKKANYLLIDISYESDLDLAIEIIQKEASKHPLSIDDRSEEEKVDGQPYVPVHCMDFKESSISLRATIFSIDNATGFEMLSDLRKKIKAEFDTQGIDIPYPHTTIVYK